MVMNAKRPTVIAMKNALRKVEIHALTRRKGHPLKIANDVSDQKKNIMVMNAKRPTVIAMKNALC